MRAARAVVKDKALHLVAELRERGRGRGAREPRAHHDDLVFPLVGRVDELDLGFMALPLVSERTGRNLGFEFGHGGEYLGVGFDQTAEDGERDGGVEQEIDPAIGRSE